MKKRLRSYATAALAATMASTALTSCSEEALSLILDLLLTDDGTTIEADGNGLGWLEKDEDTSTIEDDIKINTDDGDGSVTSKLPSKVDLTSFLPPIGDQGQYGTCVGWATAYNGRTWIEAQKNNKTTSQMTNMDIYSPSDIFRSVPSQYKGTKCQGTSLQAALDQMITRGVATMADAPYSDLRTDSDCDCAPTSGQTTAAAGGKIRSYREIDGSNLNTVKRYLSEGHPVIFGAMLGDNFMRHSGSSVLTSKGTTNLTGQHASHAMVLVGYDDDRGANGAFRVVNSWGKSWGESGFVWVDYKYFLTDFVHTAIVVYGLGESSFTYDESSDVDLMPSYALDEDYNEESDPDSEDPRWRNLYYDIYNAGGSTVECSSNWGNAYMLYNAYNANEYEIVLIDLYTNLFGQPGDMEGAWDKAEAQNVLGLAAQGYSWSHLDLPGESSVAESVMGESEAVFSWAYKVPDVTGEYYLVLIADAFSSVDESNESNNYHFIMSADGGPLHIENGVLTTQPAMNKSVTVNAKPRKNATLPQQTAVNATSPNTYSPEEIATLISEERRNGQLRNKACEWVERNAQEPLTKPRRMIKKAVR